MENLESQGKVFSSPLSATQQSAFRRFIVQAAAPVYHEEIWAVGGGAPIQEIKSPLLCDVPGSTEIFYYMVQAPYIATSSVGKSFLLNA